MDRFHRLDTLSSSTAHNLNHSEEKRFVRLINLRHLQCHEDGTIGEEKENIYFEKKSIFSDLIKI